jgi:hypothetical protein
METMQTLGGKGLAEVGGTEMSGHLYTARHGVSGLCVRIYTAGSITIVVLVYGWVEIG